jgi:hypothetical protein
LLSFNSHSQTVLGELNRPKGFGRLAILQKYLRIPAISAAEIALGMTVSAGPARQRALINPAREHCGR